MKKTAGNAASKKRNAPSSMGGTSCNPTMMTTKFKPQTTITTRASNRSLGDMTPHPASGKESLEPLSGRASPYSEQAFRRYSSPPFAAYRCRRNGDQLEFAARTTSHETGYGRTVESET